MIFVILKNLKGTTLLVIKGFENYVLTKINSLHNTY